MPLEPEALLNAARLSTCPAYQTRNLDKPSRIRYGIYPLGVYRRQTEGG
jgi:hypothetical protein